MTVQEVKKHLENMFPKNQDKRRFIEECIDIAIECMEEIEQYRALGTVEGFQKALDSSLEYYIQMKEYKAKLQEYEAIGTVEELKEVLNFKKYFDALYGEGLEIANWHKNGDLEPFDSFYESALD